MNCPHLNDCIVNINSVNYSGEYTCCTCKTTKSPWLCISCGLVNCGRYINGHAKAHYQEDRTHMVCIDCTSFSTFCYICDDYVINESKGLSALRSKLQCSNGPGSKQSKKRYSNSSEEGSENKRSKKHKKTNNQKTFCKVQISGLRNLGNTCFMNAVLQSLSNIEQFSCYFKQLPSLEQRHKVKNGKNSSNSSINDDVLLAEELRKTIISLWQGSKSAISPESLFAVVWKVVPGYKGYQQQDAHEFLRYMLDRLHMELLNILPYPKNNSNAIEIGAKGKTIVTSIFGGLFQNQITCLVCGTESELHEPFLDISLNIPQENVKPSNKSKEEEPPSVHLMDCLSSFTELEELTDAELRCLCQCCKSKQPFTKKFCIQRLPNVLCLHLKRFRWNNVFRSKLDNHVDFPIQGLDMNKFIRVNKKRETRGSSCGGTLYDLAAVIVHHGSGVGSGHYTAYATHEGCWHHFNDSSVTVTDEKTVAGCKAYILFYIRQELNLTPPNS